MAMYTYEGCNALDANNPKIFSVWFCGTSFQKITVTVEHFYCKEKTTFMMLYISCWLEHCSMLLEQDVSVEKSVAVEQVGTIRQ